MRGNRVSRHDSVNTANSEAYAYDGLNQIQSLKRKGFSEAWNFDKTGNWAEYNRNGNIEKRQHNAANEIQGIVSHDKNGNMVLMPGIKLKYDAWNRLVEVRNEKNEVVAKYSYNGLNQRIEKKVGDLVTRSFFNENWQELESKTEPGVSTPGQSGELTTYVWGLRYVDDLVCRERGEEKLYSLQDANWNVVCVTDKSGDVKERYIYDAFGKRSAQMNSAIDFDRAFTGQVLDAETGLMLYRNRYFSPSLGRFVSRDPIEYFGEDTNLMRYVRNNTVLSSDPMGLDIWVENTTAVGGWHRRVCVDTYDSNCKKTGKYCVSFGLDGGGTGGSSGGSSDSSDGSGSCSANPPGLPGGNDNPDGDGVVYEDNVDAATREVKRKSSNCECDGAAKDYMKSLVGSRGNYAIIGNSCRSFSEDAFNKMSDDMEDGSLNECCE